MAKKAKRKLTRWNLMMDDIKRANPAHYEALQAEYRESINRQIEQRKKKTRREAGSGGRHENDSII